LKVLLTIFCGLFILFTGGCALTLLSIGGGVELISVGLAIVAVLNVVLLVGLWGKGVNWSPAFYILGVADILLGLGGGIFLLFQLGQEESLLVSLAILAAAMFVLKGGLTLHFARHSSKQD
jgi:hypothetical protein